MTVELYKDEKIKRHCIKWWLYGLCYRIRFHKWPDVETRIKFRMKNILANSDDDPEWME